MKTLKFWMCVAIATLVIVAFACANATATREATVKPEVVNPVYAFGSGKVSGTQAWGYKVGNSLIIISTNGHISTIKNY